MAEQEKIFNLQLIVQKLEEELRLYRNGTTATEFAEIISEKESEIVLLNTTLEETNEKLRMLAKSSSEVIARFELLQRDRDDLAMRLQAAEQGIAISSATIEEKNTEIMLITAETRDLKGKINSLVESNASLSEDCSSRSTTIEKLQVRCASLVAEKSEKARLLEQEKAESSKKIREITVEYDRAMKVNNDLKEIITKDRTQGSELTSKLQEYKAKASSALSELSKLQEVNASLEAKVQALDESNEEKRNRLEADNLLATQQIESLTALIADQNSQLAEIKEQTETAITAREEVNKENQRKIAEMESVIRYHTKTATMTSSLSSSSSSRSSVRPISLGKYREEHESQSADQTSVLRDRTNFSNRYS